MADQGRRSFAYSHLSDSQINAPEVHIGMDPEIDDLEAFAQLAFLKQDPLLRRQTPAFGQFLKHPTIQSISAHFLCTFIGAARSIGVQHAKRTSKVPTLRDQTS